MEAEKTLYERLGGIEGITALADDIVKAHMVNDAIKARFLAVAEKPEHFAQVKQHLIHFLAAGSGGPEQYTGKDMAAAHHGMNISQGEYMSAIDDIMMVLGKHNIDEQSQKDVLAITYSLKAQMVMV